MNPADKGLFMGNWGSMNECREVFSCKPVRLHRSHEGEDAASLRRGAPSFLFIQATLRNVAAPICSRLSDVLGARGGSGGSTGCFPNRKKRLCAAFGGRKRLPTYSVGHSLSKREEPKKARGMHPEPGWLFVAVGRRAAAQVVQADHVVVHFLVQAQDLLVGGFAALDDLGDGVGL